MTTPERPAGSPAGSAGSEPGPLGREPPPPGDLRPTSRKETRDLRNVERRRRMWESREVQLYRRGPAVAAGIGAGAGHPPARVVARRGTLATGPGEPGRGAASAACSASSSFWAPRRPRPRVRSSATSSRRPARSACSSDRRDPRAGRDHRGLARGARDPGPGPSSTASSTRPRGSRRVTMPPGSRARILPILSGSWPGGSTRWPPGSRPTRPSAGPCWPT